MTRWTKPRRIRCRHDYLRTAAAERAAWTTGHKLASASAFVRAQTREGAASAWRASSAATTPTFRSSTATRLGQRAPAVSRSRLHDAARPAREALAAPGVRQPTIAAPAAAAPPQVHRPRAPDPGDSDPAPLGPRLRPALWRAVLAFRRLATEQRGAVDRRRLSSTLASPYGLGFATPMTTSGETTCPPLGRTYGRSWGNPMAVDRLSIYPRQRRSVARVSRTTPIDSGFSGTMATRVGSH
jgi:hypothetical protein